MTASANASVRILCAEPDAAALAALRSALDGEGWNLEAVADGDRCLARLERGAPDLCLVSATLPDLDGLDLIPKLLAIAPHLPVILTASPATVDQAVAAMRLGAVNVLDKRSAPARLKEVVRGALQLSWARREVDRLRLETGEGLAKVPIDEVLADLAVSGGSDVHLKVGRPPIYRVGGELRDSRFPALEDSDMRGLLLQLLGAEGFRLLERELECDAAYVLPGVARCRVNAYKRLGHYAAALRLIPLVTPTIEMMGLPEVLKTICSAPQGLILITGPTGSGKSTTMAAMMEHLNETEASHVVTIEDPIEFVYTDKRSTIDQRQLGTDTRTLHDALRRVLRQDPDIILVGEMRDRESIELAMHAAETGHLVFSTLHTNDAKQTIDRIVDMFPSEASHQIRSMLALTLHAVISQRLVRKADGSGRIAALEVMINSPNIRDLIAEGKTSQVEKVIASSADYYQMQTFNQSLCKLAMSGTVTQEDALACSANPNDLKLLLKGIGSGSAGGSRGIDSQLGLKPVGGGSQLGLKPVAPAPAKDAKSRF